MSDSEVLDLFGTVDSEDIAIKYSERQNIV